jgi:hypothetical protein
LKEEYPKVESTQKRFLNSGGIIGYVTDLYEILTSSKVADDDDDQLFYTKLFLNVPTRVSFYEFMGFFLLKIYVFLIKLKHKMKLDVNSEIFQNLNGALDEVVLVTAEDKKHMRLFNSLTDSYPSVVHGNGISKVNFNLYFY